MLPARTPAHLYRRWEMCTAFANAVGCTTLVMLPARTPHSQPEGCTRWGCTRSHVYTGWGCTRGVMLPARTPHRPPPHRQTSRNVQGIRNKKKIELEMCKAFAKAIRCTALDESFTLVDYARWRIVSQHDLSSQEFVEVTWRIYTRWVLYTGWVRKMAHCESTRLI